MNCFENELQRKAVRHLLANCPPNIAHCCVHVPLANTCSCLKIMDSELNGFNLSSLFIKPSGRKEHGEEVPRKWAFIDLCYFFIFASPKRSDIPLVKKRQRSGKNCQSFRLDCERLNPHVAYTCKVRQQF